MVALTSLTLETLSGGWGATWGGRRPAGPGAWAPAAAAGRRAPGAAARHGGVGAARARHHSEA